MRAHVNRAAFDLPVGRRARPIGNSVPDREARSMVLRQLDFVEERHRKVVDGDVTLARRRDQELEESRAMAVIR
jgi:hypothetical protein